MKPKLRLKSKLNWKLSKLPWKKKSKVSQSLKLTQKKSRMLCKSLISGIQKIRRQVNLRMQAINSRRCMACSHLKNRVQSTLLLTSNPKSIPGNLWKFQLILWKDWTTCLTSNHPLSKVLQFQLCWVNLKPISCSKRWTVVERLARSQFQV